MYLKELYSTRAFENTSPKWFSKVYLFFFYHQTYKLERVLFLEGTIYFKVIYWDICFYYEEYTTLENT